MAVGHCLKPLLTLAVCFIILDHFRPTQVSLSTETTPGYFYLSKISSRPRQYEYIGLKLSRKLKAPRTMMNNSLRIAQFVKLLNYGLLATYIILSGDVSPNPGPFDLRASKKVKGISICHWNIQHLTESKFEEISLSLHSHKHSKNKIDVLILTETFCSSKVPDSFYKIEGYDLYRKDRLHKKGGGILAFVNEHLHAKLCEELMTNNTEVLWIEVFPFKSKRSLLVAGVYRPPSSNCSDNVMH